MKLNAMYPSKYLKADDITTDRVLTISAIKLEQLGEERETKPVLEFRECDQALVLAKTNALTLAAMYGEDSDLWIGKAITIYATKVPFGGRLVNSIRVRSDMPTVKSNGNDRALPEEYIG
jgi:hypothetical protein